LFAVEPSLSLLDEAFERLDREDVSVTPAATVWNELAAVDEMPDAGSRVHAQIARRLLSAQEVRPRVRSFGEAFKNELCDCSDVVGVKAPHALDPITDTAALG
jgi:hypothetical protein